MENERGHQARSFWRKAALFCLVFGGVGCGSARGEEVAKRDDVVNGPVSDSQDHKADKGEFPALRNAFLPISLEDAVRTGTPVRIVARHSEQCLDVAGGSPDPSAKLVQWPCYQRVTNQRFLIHHHRSGYYVMVAQHSNKCLALRGNSPDSGASIIQYDCRGYESSLFSFEPVAGGYYAIRPKRNGMCLEVRGNSPHPGAGVRQRPCDLEWNQQFRLEKDFVWQ